MDFANVRYSVEGPIATIQLNRPEYKNAQSYALLQDVDDAFSLAENDDAVRVIIVRGSGGDFSAGHDLGTPDGMASRGQLEGIERYNQFRKYNLDVLLRWRNLPKPTIAEVKGYTIFAGVAIAEACDLIFAADDTMFLPTNYQYFHVPWDLGIRKAKEILFESRFIDAQEALELGLVNRVIPKARLEQETMEYAARVASNDPFQLRMIKLAINQAQDAQGFTQHIYGSYGHHILSSVGEADPGYALRDPRKEGQRRRPMVQRAIENYELEKQRRARGGADAGSQED